MKVTWQSRNYTPEKVETRYVRRAKAMQDLCEYIWIEVDANRRDVRQGSIDGTSLPVDVRAGADEAKNDIPGYVAWPRGGNG